MSPCACGKGSTACIRRASIWGVSSCPVGRPRLRQFPGIAGAVEHGAWRRMIHVSTRSGHPAPLRAARGDTSLDTAAWSISAGSHAACRQHEPTLDASQLNPGEHPYQSAAARLDAWARTTGQARQSLIRCSMFRRRCRTAKPSAERLRWFGSSRVRVAPCRSSAPTKTDHFVWFGTAATAGAVCASACQLLLFIARCTEIR